MSTQATLEATMRLEISQLQSQLAKANGEVTKWQDKLAQQSSRSATAVDAITAAHQRLAAAGKRTQELFAPKAVNPWASNAAAAAQYAQIVEQRVVPALQKQSTWQARTVESLDTNRILSQQATRAAAARGGRGGGGAGGFSNLGMVAMQAQDIAVQLQMGTRASIVLAQQGSQLLSVFGPAGMLLGGAIAIGGALYTAGERSKEAFEKAKDGAVDFDGAVKDALNGSVADLQNMLGRVADRTQELRKEMQQIATGGLMPAFMQMLGGANVQDTVTLNADQQRAALEQRRALGEQMVITSQEEAQIAALRAAGRAKEADELERQINLARELARIQKLDVDGYVKEALSRDAVTKSALPGADKREEATRIEKKIAADKMSELEPVERYLALSQEQETVFSRMATEGGMFYDASIAGLEAWAAARKKAGDTSGYLEVVKMLETALDLQKQMAAADAEAKQQRDKRDAESDAKRQDIEATKAKMQEEQERFAERYKAQQAYTQLVREEIMLLQAKAAGNDELVERMERELRIRERAKQIQEQAKQIQEQAGVTAEQARASAERIIELEDQAARRTRRDDDDDDGSGRRRGRIRLRRGQTPDRQLGDSLAGRPLGESIAYPGEAVFGYSRPLSSRTDSNITTRAVRNAERADNASTNSGGLGDLLKAQTEILKRGFFG